jgi:drug/metabolite transporter superfamily protein YnfA
VAGCAGGPGVTLLLAAVDGVVGAYLVWYAARRERRDKPAVMVTGIFLLACAAILSVLWLL